MALPGASQNILDGGMGVTSPATSTPHFVGSCGGSLPLNTPTLIANPTRLRELCGTVGQLIDAAGHTLGLAGGPVVVTRTATTVPATYGGGVSEAMEPSTGVLGTEDIITVAVATTIPLNDYELRVTIVAGGVLADTTFTYSLDGGTSQSPVIDAATTVVVGDTGVTLEFGDGTDAYVVGAVYSSVVRGPMYDSTDLATAWTAIRLSLLQWDFFAMSGQAATAAAAALIAANVSAEMTAYENTLSKYYRAIMSCGHGTPANALTAFATAFVSPRVALMYGTHDAPPPFGQTGRGLPALPASDAVARLATGNVMSTDLAQVSGASSVGALPTTLGISHNEYTQEAGLDAVKIGTLRTYPNLEGFYITNCWLKAASGSDFQWWQHGVIMDRACREVSLRHTLLISSNVIAKTDGTGSLLESSAVIIEGRVQRGLDNVIGSAIREVGPNAIDGTTGHVSDIKYQVDRTNDVLATSTLLATVAIVPRGYLKTLTTTLAFRLST